jgi:hypothetical protein
LNALPAALARVPHGGEEASSLRLSLVLTPKLSFQLYLQGAPFARVLPRDQGIDRTPHLRFPYYGKDVGTLVQEPNGAYTIDPDGEGPAPSFGLSNPHFNFKSLRVNGVARWEFRPGSAF